MAGPTLDKVLAEVDALTPDDQQKVRNHLHRLFDEKQAQCPEDLLQQKLLEAGVIKEVRPRRKRANPPDEFKLVKVKGKPVSQTIIEERRGIR